MLITFLGHQWTGFWRSKSKSGSIVTQLILGFIVLYMLGVSVLVGYSMEELIKEFLPQQQVILVFNGIILYYFAVDFLMRVQMQELPTIAIQPYLHLHIPKRKIIGFLNIRAFFSPFNIFPLLLFFPFCVLKISRDYGAITCIMYMVTIFSLMFFNNYTVLYLKRKAIQNIRVVLAGVLFVAVLGGLEYFKILSLSALSNLVFHYLILYPFTGIVFVVLAMAAFVVNDRFLRNNLYLEELRSGEKKKSSTDYPFLDRFGEAGTLIALELKLILRNKRPRTTAAKGFLFLLYGILLYKQNAIEANKFALLLFAALFMTGNTTLVYGQFMFGWQSAEFDGLLANRMDIKTFFKAKFIMLTLISTLLTVLASFYGFMSWKLLFLQFAAYAYNIGISPIGVFYFATRNYKSIDLSKGANFNWQGVGASTMLMALPILVLPYLIYLPVTYFTNAYWGLAALTVVGLAGLFSRSFWIDLLVKEFNKRKYQIAAGFRERS